MNELHIPDTATETYLERLAENIKRQLDKTENQNVRENLESMLLEVHARMKELHRTAQKFPEREGEGVSLAE